jgi:hypothetical protein
MVQEVSGTRCDDQKSSWIIWLLALIKEYEDDQDRNVIDTRQFGNRTEKKGNVLYYSDKFIRANGRTAVKLPHQCSDCTKGIEEELDLPTKEAQ